MGVPQASEGKVALPRPLTERRRIRKPIMEKRRRDRINGCLDELSSLLAEERLEEGEASRLEKADILDLTVRYWQGVRNLASTSEEGGEVEALVASTPDESSYLTGYKQCIRVVDDLLSTCQESGTEALRQGLLQHLSSCVEELTPPPSAPDATVKGPTPASPPTSGAAPGNTPPPAPLQSLALVPARLPDGGLALLLQEGSESKDSMKNGSQQTASSGSGSGSSSEPDASSSTSSASSVPHTEQERSEQHPRVKATPVLLTGPSARDDNSGDPPPAAPPLATTAPATPTTEDGGETSAPRTGGLTGAQKASDTPEGFSEESPMTIEEVKMEEEEGVVEVEGETPMDLCIDRVWRPW